MRNLSDSEMLHNKTGVIFVELKSLKKALKKGKKKKAKRLLKELSNNISFLEEYFYEEAEEASRPKKWTWT